MIWLMALFRKPGPFIAHKTYKRQVAELALMLGLCCALFVLVMVAWEGMPVADALWLTATTITTTGYGDLFAKTDVGRLATVLIIYIPGIAVFAKVVNVFQDMRLDALEQKKTGLWRWNMEGHIVIVGAPTGGGETYYEGVMRELRRSQRFGGHRVLVLTRDWADGIPPRLAQLGMVHRHGDGSSAEDLEAAGVAKADAVVVLATAPEADGLTFSTVSLLREVGAQCPVVAECVKPESRDRIRRAGATSVIKPTRAYPDMLVRAMVAPGAESVLENLMSAEGDELMAFPVAPRTMAWKEVVRRLVDADLGIPIAYGRQDGTVMTNPRANDPVTASVLYMVCHEESPLSAGQVEAVLAA